MGNQHNRPKHQPKPPPPPPPPPPPAPKPPPHPPSPPKPPPAPKPKPQPAPKPPPAPQTRSGNNKPPNPPRNNKPNNSGGNNKPNNSGGNNKPNNSGGNNKPNNSGGNNKPNNSGGNNKGIGNVQGRIPGSNGNRQGGRPGKPGPGRGRPGGGRAQPNPNRWAQPAPPAPGSPSPDPGSPSTPDPGSPSAPDPDTTAPLTTDPNPDNNEDNTGPAPTPPTAPSAPPVTPPELKEVAADPDLLLQRVEGAPIELIEEMLFQSISSLELINIMRDYSFDGQRIFYQPIENLEEINREYNPQSITNPAFNFANWKRLHDIEDISHIIYGDPTSPGAVRLETLPGRINIAVALPNLTDNQLIEVAVSYSPESSLYEQAFPGIELFDGGWAAMTDLDVAKTIDGGDSDSIADEFFICGDAREFYVIVDGDDATPDFLGVVDGGNALGYNIDRTLIGDGA